MCVLKGMLNPVWLRPYRTEALTVTDKRPAPSVKSTWHQVSFSLADAKSMTEAPAGGQAGGRPLLAPFSAGWKIQRQASSIRESLFTMMMTISLCLHSLCYLNPSLSSLWPPLLSLCRCLSHILLTSPLPCSRQLSQEVCVKRLYLWGAVKQRKAGGWMWKIVPLISTKFDFSPPPEMWGLRLPLHFPTPLWCFASIFLNSVFIAFAFSLWLFPHFLSSPSLPVRLSGILPRLFEEEQ